MRTITAPTIVRRAAQPLVILLLAGACGDDDTSSTSPSSFPPAVLDPGDPVDVDTMAAASAPRVFMLGYMGVGLATFENGELCTTVDGMEMCMPIGNGCPAMTETDDGFVVEGGGCATDDGDVWTGRVVGRGVSLSDDGGVTPSTSTATIDYEGLTIASPSECPDAQGTSRLVLDGRLSMTPTDASGSAFDFDLQLQVEASGLSDECDDIGSVAGAYDYQGSRRNDGTREIWSGSGVIGSSKRGSFEGETIDEVIDSSVCQYEALSGTTTVTAGDDVAVLTYDGATSCDETSTVAFAFNGTDMGEIEGVQCAVGRSRGRGPLGAGLLACLLLFRRRPFRPSAAR
jgi:hypothetical protein